MEERKALPVHHTETVDKPWDGPANEARLENDADAGYYRQAYAWVDPEADPDTKSAYKFIHHEVSAGGEVGPANLRGCYTGIAVLNGARGGADIPDADREGVWRHLAAHLEDGDVEPTPLRSAPPDAVRSFIGEVEVRVTPYGERRLIAKEDGLGVLQGRPGVPYGQWSEDLGGFVETIRPGAWTPGEVDVVCCYEHNLEKILGRVSAGTLKLENTPNGIDYDCYLSPTTYASDLVKSIRAGNIRGNSFEFVALEDVWDGNRREIIRMELYEVGPVAQPANPSTSVSLRSLLRSIGVNEERLGVAVRRARSGTPRGEDVDVIAGAVAALSTYLPAMGRAARAGAETDRQELEPYRLGLKLMELIEGGRNE